MPDHPPIVLAAGEAPLFRPGDAVRILSRAPVGHYRVPRYVRGVRGRVERVVEPSAVDNEEEGFGRNAGSRLHYYRLALPMPALWPGYAPTSCDELNIEVYETWLERVEA
ncbi:MAG TPA: SH3-like domain-containing protein [Allosphingosinicella sp.]|jgi:nitrile hydratase